MSHRTPNARLFPVRQVSNADLFGMIFRNPVEDDSVLFVSTPGFGEVYGIDGDRLADVTDEYFETLSILADPETMAAIEAGEADVENGAVLTLDDVIDQAHDEGFLGDDMDVENLRFYYDSFKIEALRKIASKAGFVGAYKGPKKPELVEWCVQASVAKGERV